MSMSGSQPRRTGRWPRRGAGDTALLLWRAKWLMLVVFVPSFLIGAAAVMSVPQTVEARTRLLVSGPETVDLAREMELFGSVPVRERTISRFSMSRLYPGIEQACRRARKAGTGREALEQACRNEAAIWLGRGLALEPSSGSSFSARFRHNDPGVAVEVLNALTGAYLGYRDEHIQVPEDNPVRAKRRELEATRDRIAADLAALAGQAEVQDPEAELTDTQILLTAAKAEAVRAHARAVQVNAEADEFRERLEGLEPEQFAFVEDTSARTLMQLQAERDKAIATFGADAGEVAALEERIAQAEAYLRSRGGMVGTARREPNPVYQDAEIALARVQAEAGALAAQRQVLQRRISALEARQAELQAILPAYRELVLERNINGQALIDLAGSEAEYDAAAVAGRERLPVVTVLQPAEIVHASHGDRALRLLVCAGLAALLALMAGLLKSVLTLGFATPGMVERTLRLPVLGVVRRFR